MRDRAIRDAAAGETYPACASVFGPLGPCGLRPEEDPVPSPGLLHYGDHIDRRARLCFIRRSWRLAVMPPGQKQVDEGLRGMRVAMIGTGYVGLVSGACMADFGHQVVCVDKDRAKISALSAGEVPIFEPGLEDLVHSNVRQGRLSFTTAMAEAV